MAIEEKTIPTDALDIDLDTATVVYAYALTAMPASDGFPDGMILYLANAKGELVGYWLDEEVANSLSSAIVASLSEGGVEN